MKEFRRMLSQEIIIKINNLKDVIPDVFYLSLEGINVIFLRVDNF